MNQSISSIAEKKISILEKRILKAKVSKKLDLSDLSLTSIPTEVLDLTHIESIALTNNLGLILGNELAKFSNLRFLKIDYLGLTKVPEIVTQISSLESLDISGNCISELPETFSNLKNLKRFKLYNCDFEVFPKVLYQLEKLEDLNLAFQEKQNAIHINQALRNLKKLNLNANYGSTVSVKLPKLIVLNLDNCGLKSFESICIHKKLKSVSIRLNKNLNFIPNQIVELQKLQAIHFYLSDDFQGIDKLNELPKLKRIHVQFLSTNPKKLKDILKIISFTDLYLEGSFENRKLWKKILKKPNLEVLYRISNYYDEKINIQRARNEIGIKI
ncbi:MAG: hypothetical protein O9267_00390 [Flavobacterium sp.]|uniref:leucine-rich repeat domain-containing protein n=1 Tax=Flavobacterium sp. TaxID=239 RepID=UPI0022C1AE6F|nr:hypothetical protein [Flavobacterium sp.]MCZ8196047.1 hypothetical protein [Flavobacterium sp.]